LGGLAGAHRKEADPNAVAESPNAAGLYHTAFLMPTR